MRVAPWVLAASLLGCVEEGPRRLGFPTLVVADLVPELAEKAATHRRDARKKPPSEFDRLVAGEAPKSEEPVKGRTAKRQAVPLSGRLVGELPAEFDEWIWSTDGNVTLAAHIPPGGVADVLIYSEAFGEKIATRPSGELRRFHHTVDPTLMDQGIPAAIAAVSQDLLPLEYGALVGVVSAFTTRTMGRGIGYRSTRGAFGGWKYVGRNANGLELRFARTTGQWGPARAVEAGTRDALKSLARDIPGLSVAAEAIEKQGSTAPAGTLTDRPAYQLLGSVVVQGDVGLHLAVVCARAPRCPKAEEVGQFLDSLRPPTQNDPRTLPAGAPSLNELAEKLGVPLAPREALVNDPWSVLKRSLPGASTGEQAGAVPLDSSSPSGPGDGGVPDGGADR